MNRENLFAPESEEEAAGILLDRPGFAGVDTAGSVLVDSGSYYKSGTGEDGIIINPSGFGDIHEISGRDMLAVAGGGVEAEELSAAAAEKGLYFPSWNSCCRGLTLAQLVDEGPVSDLRRVYGGMREYILGFRVATPGGRMISSGSRAVKDVSGYDLAGFAMGSLGRCGLVTEVTARLLPARRFLEIRIYSCGEDNFREASMEINRQIGAVGQKIYLGRAASLLAGRSTGGNSQPGGGEALLEVRFESETEEGRARTGDKID
ncbi:MAG: FAD-binding protein, partial [Candidatus Latescibacteria bacterium]|nr:FAD-binding protein [bacterium]MBD3425451.1 FAD-binding protein [Candidatus Latescibacterota bacterium]